MDATDRRPRVLVLFGGTSGEHAISCVTAAGVLGAIDTARYDVLAVGITRTGRWVEVSADPAHWQITDGRLPEVEETAGRVLLPQAGDVPSAQVIAAGEVPRDLGAVDVVVPLLHGPYGEDGTLQGLLELAGVRYVGAGVLASAVAMDKHYMKLVLAGHGLPIGPYAVIPPGEWDAHRDAWTQTVATLGLPVFVKPARAGSSLGISRVDDLAELPAAVDAAREHDPKVLVEAGIDGREIECAVLQGRDGAPPRVSLPGEVLVVGGGHEFYDFEAKYLDEAATELICPAELPDDVTARVQDLARRTFQAVGCEGLARVDTFVLDGGEVVVNEINTMPGFTPTSMYPLLWRASGLAYPELVDELIQLALHRPLGLR